MSFNPKTPTRRSRPTTKTPLTPSLTAGINVMNISSSPTKFKHKSSTKTPSKSSNAPLAPSNLFQPSRSTSRPTSPLKRIINGGGGIQVTDELKRQASSGIIRRGGLESKMDVIKFDYVMPTKGDEQSSNGVKRSKSQPAGIRREKLFPNEPSTIPLDTRDRFITARDIHDLESTLAQMHIAASTLSSSHSSSGISASTNLSRSVSNPPSQNQGSPGHTARLAEAANIPINKRVLSYHEPPPPSSQDPMLVKQREIVKPLYARPGALSSSTGTSTNKTRKIPTQPERVLDAPGMVDDFYLNLISWSINNVVAVALGESTYLWKAETGSVVHLGDAPEGSYVSSVDFSNDGLFLGIGIGTGVVELWDVETQTKLRSMSGHSHQIAVLSWNQHILSSGCGDGSIWHHDVRVARHKVMELLGHSGEVCGMKWRADGELLASGGNDNVVNVWDGRAIGEGGRGEPKWVKRNHTAAVKALAWSPWLPALLASGGGTNDSTINIWNTTTGARLHSHHTPAQITSLHFSPHKKEILSTHGYPTNSIMIHSYPNFEKIGEVRDAHDSRVLFSCIGPKGDVVLTGAGDENLKFWRIWEVPKILKGKKEGRSNGISDGLLTMR